MLLPEAFRSLSRLSSALSAKASTLRSCSLDLFVLLSGAASLACEAALHLQSHGSIEELLLLALVAGLLVNLQRPNTSRQRNIWTYGLCVSKASISFVWSVTFVTASDVLNILLVKYFNFYMQFSRCK